MKLFLCFVAVALWAQAGEFAVLSSGFRIHADSHTVDGGMVHLETSGGAIDLPASAITAFETEDYVPPAPPESPTSVPQPLAQPKLDPRELVTQAAERVGLPPAIVHSIARAESGYREDAVSPKGALGIMQLMPATAADLHADPRDPAQNADAGARYLRDLLEKYENDPHQVSKAVAAYNAGPAAVDKYHGVPPYAETVQYVNRVLKEYEKELAQPRPAEPRPAEPRP
jgi:soluble lytic murein transglycosylase-like protein